MSDLGRSADVGCDVVAVGETMALVTPTTAVPLETSDHLVLRAGGAESNVAMHLAGLGYRTRWVSRVGDDPLGRIVMREIEAAGVDIAGVVTDPTARTGVYFKDPDADGTRVHYYRDGSAARRMDASLLADPCVTDTRVLHLSGITAALSASCLDLVRAAVAATSTAALVSFDVNHRPALWAPDEAGPVLAELADGSDLVFVGLDEAERLWGCAVAEDVRERLPSPATLVVKDGAVGAHAFTAEGATFVPALPVNVVEPVGAGDAFAAGYLAGVLDGADQTSRLRFGHLVASRILHVTGDQVNLPPRAWFDERLQVAPEAWERLDLGDVTVG